MLLNLPFDLLCAIARLVPEEDRFPLLLSSRQLQQVVSSLVSAGPIRFTTRARPPLPGFSGLSKSAMPLWILSG